jgi:hypothetical protein
MPDDALWFGLKQKFFLFRIFAKNFFSTLSLVPVSGTGTDSKCTGTVPLPTGYRKDFKGKIKHEITTLYDVVGKKAFPKTGSFANETGCGECCQKANQC